VEEARAELDARAQRDDEAEAEVVAEGLIASMNDLAPGRGIGELTDHPCREARNVLKAGRHTPELETGVPPSVRTPESVPPPPPSVPGSSSPPQPRNDAAKKSVKIEAETGMRSEALRMSKPPCSNIMAGSRA
jgi:hypothetical protein